MGSFTGSGQRRADGAVLKNLFPFGLGYAWALIGDTQPRETFRCT